jgi:transcription elongation factor GreA
MKMKKEERHKTTKEGFKKLMEELKYREKALRAKIANTLSEMRNQGDLRENDGYSMAVEEQNINEEKIRELKEKIQNVEIVKITKTDRVEMGHTVTLKNSKDIVYEITSEEEANPLEGKISPKSPIGSAIMGKKVGDEVEITTPKGKTIYIIKKID